MRTAQGQRLLGDAGGRADGERFAVFGRGAIAVAVAIGQRMLGIVERQPPQVGDVGLVGRQGPAEAVVVPQAEDRAAIHRGAGKVQAGGTANVGFEQLRKAEPGQVRIGQQHGIARGRLGRGDGPAVRALRGPNHVVRAGQIGVRKAGAAERQLEQDVPAEDEHLPGLEMSEQLRPNVGMGGQIIVQAGGERFAMRLDFGIEIADRRPAFWERFRRPG